MFLIKYSTFFQGVCALHIAGRGGNGKTAWTGQLEQQVELDSKRLILEDDLALVEETFSSNNLSNIKNELQNGFGKQMNSVQSSLYKKNVDQGKVNALTREFTPRYEAMVCQHAPAILQHIQSLDITTAECDLIESILKELPKQCMRSDIIAEIDQKVKAVKAQNQEKQLQTKLTSQVQDLHATAAADFTKVKGQVQTMMRKSKSASDEKVFSAFENLITAWNSLASHNFASSLHSARYDDLFFKQNESALRQLHDYNSQYASLFLSMVEAVPRIIDLVHASNKRGQKLISTLRTIKNSLRLPEGSDMSLQFDNFLLKFRTVELKSVDEGLQKVIKYQEEIIREKEDLNSVLQQKHYDLIVDKSLPLLEGKAQCSCDTKRCTCKGSAKKWLKMCLKDIAQLEKFQSDGFASSKTDDALYRLNKLKLQFTVLLNPEDAAAQQDLNDLRAIESSRFKQKLLFGAATACTILGSLMFAFNSMQ